MITKGNTARLLGFMAAYDKRTVGEADIEAWFKVMPVDIGFDTACEAVRLYYQQEVKPIMPAQLIQYAKLVPHAGRKPLYGEPGEIICKKCSRVHFPEEGCSALITIQQYGVQRFWDEVDKRRAELGYGPLDTRRRRRMAKGLNIPVPDDVEDLSGF